MGHVMSVYCCTHQTIRQQIWEGEPERLIPTLSPPTHSLTHTHIYTHHSHTLTHTHTHIYTHTHAHSYSRWSITTHSLHALMLKHNAIWQQTHICRTCSYFSSLKLRRWPERQTHTLPADLTTNHSSVRPYGHFRKMLCLELISCLLKDANYKNVGQKHTKAHTHRCKHIERGAYCWNTSILYIKLNQIKLDITCQHFN